MEVESELFSRVINNFINSGSNSIPGFNRSHLVVISSLIFICSLNISAQSFNLQSEQDNRIKIAYNSIPALDTNETENSAIADSMPPPPKPRLLPDNISFGEKLFWGENGVFRSIGIASPLSPDVRRSELSTRRFMLTAHQISGFATVALMITAAYFGQKTIDNHMNRTYSDTHQNFVDATIATYSLTAALAILSPPPMIRRDDEESTTTLHKTLAWIHAAGMIITPILGSMIGERRSFNMDKAHFHQVAGYITTAVFTTSLIVVTF
jgi:hypothetical protein